MILPALRNDYRAAKTYQYRPGLPTSEAADLVQNMVGPYRLPDALRRADALSRSMPIGIRNDATIGTLNAGGQSSARRVAGRISQD